MRQLGAGINDTNIGDDPEEVEALVGIDLGTNVTVVFPEAVTDGTDFVTISPTPAPTMPLPTPSPTLSPTPVVSDSDWLAMLVWRGHEVFTILLCHFRMFGMKCLDTFWGWPKKGTPLRF